MKLSHDWNGWGRDRTDPAWSARVEAEAQRTTDAAEANAQRHAERLARAEQRLADARAKLAKDTAAGAVMAGSVAAAVAGIIIFLPKLLPMLQ